MKYSDKNPPLVLMQTNSTCYKQTRYLTQIKGILIHCTGCNNPKISRYVQPLASDPNYNYWIQLLGDNPNDNDWNHIYRKAGVNAWIGKLADGSVSTVQTMPWEYCPWGCGVGVKGSCNDGWIQFEMCEDNLYNADYFNQVYREACELTAYLCKKYKIDPIGNVMHNKIKVPTILCHQDSYKLGLGGNHSDIYNWFPKHGKTMNDFRQDVKALLEEEEEVTQEQFNQMMDNYLANLCSLEPDKWSESARQFCESNGIIKGDDQGYKMYKKLLTKEEAAQMIYNILNKK